MDPEAGILLGESIEVLPEKNVLLGDVGEDEIDLGLVAGSTSTDDGLDNLEHGGDAGSSSNHTKVPHHVRSVDESTLWTAHSDSLANSESGQVLGDVAGGVGLDEQVEVAGLVIARDGGIRANNLLAGAVGLGDGGANRDVLTDRKTKDRGRGGELESVTNKNVSRLD